MREVAPGEWGLTLEAAGYALDIGVAIRGPFLRAQAAVLPAGLIDPHQLLYWNRQAPLVCFAENRAGEVWVCGEVPLEPRAPRCSISSSGCSSRARREPASSSSRTPERNRYGEALMRIATWNVNSIKQRVPRLFPWLDERAPDVVCLQETKLADDALMALLGDDLEARGYAVAAHGERSWNGVAILSRVGLDDVVNGLEGAPGFPHPEARVGVRHLRGIRVVSVYVPNGRTPDSEHYQYKLAWLASLRDAVAAHPGDTIVCGDMNIAPADEDVFDPEAYVGQTHVTPPERAALAELQALGLHDVVRDALADRAGVHLTGTTGPGCSTRTWGCGSTSPARQRRRRRPGEGRVGRSSRAQGHRAERSRAGHR